MREIPNHPMELGFLQPGWQPSGLSKREREPVEDVYVFADKSDAIRRRTLFQGPGRQTRVDRKTVKFDGLSITVHVLVIRRVQ